MMDERDVQSGAYMVIQERIAADSFVDHLARTIPSGTEILDEGLMLGFPSGTPIVTWCGRIIQRPCSTSLNIFAEPPAVMTRWRFLCGGCIANPDLRAMTTTFVVTRDDLQYVGG